MKQLVIKSPSSDYRLRAELHYVLSCEGITVLLFAITDPETWCYKVTGNIQWLQYTIDKFLLEHYLDWTYEISDID